jgi:hypothetical protein
MKVEPKLTRAQVKEWCPKPRGLEEPGNHAKMPSMQYENAGPKELEDNRRLTQEISAAFKRIKSYANDDPKDPEKGPRFVIQWRMFANASNPNINNPAQCGCGCSCGCA